MAPQTELSTTVAKAFNIIELLASKTSSGVSIGELSEYMNVSKSTAFRYLATLESLNVIERDASDRFRLGVKLIELTGAYLAKNDLRVQSMPLLDELNAVLHQGKSPKEGMKALLSRDPRPEAD